MDNCVEHTDEERLILWFQYFYTGRLVLNTVIAAVVVSQEVLKVLCWVSPVLLSFLFSLHYTGLLMLQDQKSEDNQTK